MQITNWSPFMEPFDVEKEFEKFFKSAGFPASGLSTPSMDVFKKGNDIVVQMSVPGIDASNVEIEIDEKNILTVKGSTKKKTEVDDKNYYKREISHGSFFRSMMLPAEVKRDKAKAEVEDGLLTINIPMESQKKAQTIKVEQKKTEKKSIGKKK